MAQARTLTHGLSINCLGRALVRTFSHENEDVLKFLPHQLQIFKFPPHTEIALLKMTVLYTELYTIKAVFSHVCEPHPIKSL